MYLVIGPGDKGYWIQQVRSKADLITALNEGCFRGKYDNTEDITFVETLPKLLDRCARMEDFKPNDVMIVEIRKIIIPEAYKVATKFRVED